jgi:transposase
MERTIFEITFVGIDAHSQNCSIKAINMQGHKIAELDVPTEKRKLSKALSLISGPVWAMLESSFIAAFVKECIEDTVDRVIVCETRENRWISKSENKSDQADADRLARLLRMGEYKEVYVPKGIDRDRREVLNLYTRCQGDVARTKNRIKAKYREHGINVKGTKVYGPKRDSFIMQIDSVPVRNSLSVLYKKLDSDVAAGQEVLAELVRLVKETREYQVLTTLPGVAKIRAATLSSIIGDPHRFENKRALWSYAGLGVSSRWSSNPDRAQIKGSKAGNRLLKHTALSAAKSAIGCDNRFSRHYQKMLSSGVKESNALRTVARQILAAALFMLKNGEEYRDTI